MNVMPPPHPEHHPMYHHQHVHYYNEMRTQPPQYRRQHHRRESSGVSRAVSSSFDRSVKSRDNVMDSMPTDDASWGQLQQVTSVDEEEMKKRMRKKEHADDHSTSSSLTNSPVDKRDQVAAGAKRRPESISLDLMQCPSGTSMMLLQSASFEAKREMDEERDSETPTHNDSAHSGREQNMPPTKKVKKESPLSLTLDEEKMKSRSPHLGYSFSVDTQHVLGRPNSAASSAFAPLSDAVNQLPSWDLAPQNSFGNDSVTTPLMNSFSFANDLAEHHGPPPPPYMAPPHIETRNQSFEGGHYHGSFDRNMSYDQGHYDAYRGPYPPHHGASWGSHGSYPYPPPPPGYRYPPMVRNFSEDSRVMPPSEFRAPPPSLPQKAKGQVVVSNYVPNKRGPYSWMKEEDDRLTDIMKKVKNPRDWEPIARQLGTGRTAKECHERWIRYLKPGVRKGQWTDQEDQIVVDAVANSSEQPFTRWSDLAQRLPGRVGKQIRDRWVNHLNPSINHLPFSREDDLLLWEGHEDLGKRWVEISSKYFNGSRSENHIKNRWYSASFKKFITNEFGPDAYAGVRGSSTKKDAKKRKRDSLDESEISA